MLYYWSILLPVVKVIEMEEAEKSSCQLPDGGVVNLGSDEGQHENTNQSETELASGHDGEGNEV